MDKLRALEYFVAAAEEGSFSAAARRLQVSAMAVSKLVGSLEAQLGTSLFERHARGLSVTGGGATSGTAVSGGIGVNFPTFRSGPIASRNARMSEWKSPPCPKSTGGDSGFSRSIVSYRTNVPPASNSSRTIRSNRACDA